MGDKQEGEFHQEAVGEQSPPDARQTLLRLSKDFYNPGTIGTGNLDNPFDSSKGNGTIADQMILETYRDELLAAAEAVPVLEKAGFKVTVEQVPSQGQAASIYSHNGINLMKISRGGVEATLFSQTRSLKAFRERAHNAGSTRETHDSYAQAVRDRVALVLKVAEMFQSGKS